MAEPNQLASLPRFPIAPQAPDSGSAWRLDLGGLVARPLALDEAALHALPAVELTADFCCEEGWWVPGLRWRGVALSTLLAQAKPAAAARFVAIEADGFIAVLPIPESSKAAPLVAYALNGEPLACEHGGPLRLVAAGLVCYRSVKWVRRISVAELPPLETAAKPAAPRLARSRGCQKEG